MKKEIIVCIIIVIAIIVGNIVTQNYTVKSIGILSEELEELNLKEPQYTREGNLAKAAEIKYGKIPELTKKLEEANLENSKDNEDKRLLREEISEDDIAQVISVWTGIPVSKMLASEKQK